MESYVEIFGRLPDFRVRYRWLGRNGQRRPQKLFQHIRSDFCYAELEKGNRFENQFMIWPEFEAEDGSVIAEGENVPSSRIAGMWILVEEMRDFHRERIKAGVKGFMVGGSTLLAEVEVIEVLSLVNR